MNNIGIVLLATNAYFVLGLRFIKRFYYFYEGQSNIKFYFFSDKDPRPYLSDNMNVNFYYDSHSNWVDGTNSKFKNILSISEDLIKQVDYLYYFDADTNINNPFTEDWFIGNLVGGEHYGNRNFLSDGKGFDRNPESRAYVPETSDLPYTYYYGAFFGGKTEYVINFCNTLRNNQLADKEIGYEPGVNDESYINQYFHFNPPTRTIPCDKFMFHISDKGGIGETRNPSLDIENHLEVLIQNKDSLFNLQNNKVCLYV